jgi:hypothetical protein
VEADQSHWDLSLIKGRHASVELFYVFPQLVHAQSNSYPINIFFTLHLRLFQLFSQLSALDLAPFAFSVYFSIGIALLHY